MAERFAFALYSINKKIKHETIHIKIETINLNCIKDEKSS